MPTPPATPRLVPGLTCAILAGILIAGLTSADDYSSESWSSESWSSESWALTEAVGARDASLTGEAIYRRVLDNTFDSFVQTSSLFSGDRGGNEQWSRFKVWFQTVREDGADPGEGEVVSRSRVYYTEPFELRHTGYLVLSRSDGASDQFIYMPSQRRVKRVSLRGEAVFGSDFSFEDILPREIEDAEYKRLADERTLGRDCFVIEAVPQEHARSEYSRMVVHIDKERSIPLLTRYWNGRGIEIKELRADPGSMELIENVWVVKRMTMRHLKLETYTRLELASIQANPKLNDAMFDLRRLESRGR